MPVDAGRWLDRTRRGPCGGCSAYHERQVLPENRAELKPELNAYSVRNRFLMQTNHLPYGLPLSTLIRGLLRNALVIAGTKFRETSSLPALRSARALAPAAQRKREWIRRKTRVRPNEIGKWFRSTPVAEPALSFKRAERTIETVTAIVVNYNSGERLLNCLTALACAPLSGLRLCVVDNGSTDESLAPVGEKLPGITILEQGRNSGFAAALNRAAAELPADAYLVLNPDISIRPNDVTRLRAALDTNADLGAVSPVLRGPDGRPQWSYLLRELPTLASTAAEILYLHRLCPRNRFTAAYLPLSDRFKRRSLLRQSPVGHRPFENPSRPLLVGQPAAACLLVRGAAWAAVGGFDERFYPAWFEDVDFCKRLAEAGFLCGVTPDASAAHEGGYSAASLGRAGFYSIWYPNLLRYWHKHTPGPRYAALRFTVGCALLCRAAASYLKSFRSPQRENERTLARTLATLAFTAGSTPR